MNLVHVSARSPRSAMDAHVLMRRWGGWAALTLSVVIYATVSVDLHQPFHAGGMALRYFDLRIYRLGALRLMHGPSLYGRPMLDHLGFTYPPFAAFLMRPLGWLPLPVDERVVTGLNVLLLVWIMRRSLLVPCRGHARGLVPRSVGQAQAWSLAAALAAAAVWLEPVSVTLGYGQINLLIAALIVFDLSRDDQAQTKGIAIGVAAAIKLTPLLFIAYLLLSRRRRAAAVAAATFAAAIALSFAVTFRAACGYWLRTVFDTSRIGNAIDPMDQSLHGAIGRLTGSAHPGGGWELLVVAIAACGLGLAVLASRRDDEAAGFSLAALSTLLASPISWSHHWTLAVPALVLLGGRGYAQRSRALMAASAALGAVGYAYLPELARDDSIYARALSSLLTTDPYPVLAMLVLAVCLASAIRTHLREPRRPRRIPGTRGLRIAPTAGADRLNHGLR